MFQTDDWEIGEDFLDDFLPEDERSKKIAESVKKENSHNKRKVDLYESSFLLPPPEEKIPKSKTETKDSSRRNKILKMCAASKIQNSKASDQENPQSSTQNLENSETSNQQKELENFRKASNDSAEIRKPEEPKSPEISRESQNVENPPENLKSNREEARTNLINSILKRFKKPESDKEDSSDKVRKNLSRENLLNSILRKSSERSQNLNTTQEIPEPEELNILSFQVDDFPKPRRNVSFSNEIDEKAERRKKLILQTLKRGSEKASSSKDDSRLKNDMSTSSIDSRSRNDSKSSTTSKQVVTRKFAGPAGLLPDDIDLSKFPMAYLSSFEESENDRVLNESRISDFCSQNTKNLFTGGAWQAMVDDLPPDFLQGHDISAIKYNAGKRLYKTDQAPFMAAILHNVDSNWIVNPMILLKDSTDQIEASFHVDIFNMYPNKIEPGNVILLKDVGIISSKLCIYALIHPNDILAIYNELGRIVTTELMKEILKEEQKRGNGGIREEELREKRSSFRSSLGTDVSFRREERISRKEIEKRNEERSRETQVDPQTEELLIISPSDSIISPQPGPSKPRRSVTPTDPNPMEREFSQILNDDDEDDEAFLLINMEEITASQDTKHFASSTLIGSQIIPEEKKTNPKDDKKSLKERKKTPVKKRCNLRKETPKKSSTVKDFLKQFKCKDDLTQPEVNVEDEGEQERNERVEDKIEEGNEAETSNFADLLGSDDDFEEEIPTNVDSLLKKTEELLKECNKNPEENLEKGEKPEQHVYEDPIDVILSQVDMDIFNVDE